MTPGKANKGTWADITRVEKIEEEEEVQEDGIYGQGGRREQENESTATRTGKLRD